MCRGMVDIQSATAEIRRGKKGKKIEETTGQKYNGPLLHRAAITRMWAVAHRDGRPAKYRWRPLRKFRNHILVPRRKVWLTPAAGVPCSNAANIGERKIWT